MTPPSSDDGHYRRLLERSPAGVLFTTYGGEILAANQAAADALGFDDPEELVGSDVRNRYRDAGDREALLADLRREGEVLHRELAMKDRQGNEAHLLVSIREEDHPDLGEGVLLSTWVDVTRQRKLRDRLEHLATHDELTDLLNRRALFERSTHVLAMCEREDRRAAALYVDIAGFKEVNEQLGHKGGDEILAAVGRRLEATTRDSDLVARIGGDEFLILATLLREEEDARQVGRRLTYAFEEPFEVSDRSVRLQPAAGIAIYPDDGADLDTLLHRADRALWGPERKKPTGIRRYRPGIRGTDAAPEWDVPKELNRALQSGTELFQLYQPIVSAAGTGLVGLESLVRWQHPEHGLLEPGAFIREAEASGLVRRMDRAVFRRSVEQAADWIDRGLPFGWMSVNLSAQSLSDPESVEWARRVLDQNPAVLPDRIVIEITEHTAMQQVSRSDTLDRLQGEVGVSIAIDDFGIGYSSLLYLREFPADYLKIDLQFVRDVVESEADQKVVDGIIALGDAFDMELIAEGVETEAQEAWLRDAACDHLQGYLFGRPASPEDTEALLRAS